MSERVQQLSELLDVDANDPVALGQALGSLGLVLNTGAFTVGGGTVQGDATTLGFYGATAVAKQSGVAVTAGAIHAALVNLGLIAA